MILNKKLNFKRIMTAFLLSAGLIFAFNPVLACAVPQTPRPNQSRAPAAEANNTAPNAAVGLATSLNWAGYVSQRGVFTGVGGDWTVPETTSPKAGLAGNATWVGIGGVGKKDLIQAGTMALTDPLGRITYQAWYELLPDYSKRVNLAVKPGDSMSVEIKETSPDQWSIALTNNTTGQSVNLAVPYASSLSSAEWIQEMPMINDSYMELNNFGSVIFSKSWAIKDGKKINLSDIGALPVSMVNLVGEKTAKTGVVFADSSFSISRTAAESAVPVMALTYPRQRISRAAKPRRKWLSYSPSRNSRAFTLTFGDRSWSFEM